MQATYQGRNGGKNLKPGYLTEKNGAVLEFIVDSQSSKDPELVVTYTEGYDGWGSATVACIHGCNCKSFTINAHTQDSKFSLLKT